MSRFRACALASYLGLFSAAFAPALKADEWNKRTILEVKEPLEVPTTTLQPGKYVIKLMDSQSDGHIVQIFDEDGRHLIATILAIPNYRLQPTGKSEFGFWETPAGQPKALRSWFYPGDNFGQEFAYPKDQAAQITSAVNQPVPTTDEQPKAEVAKAEPVSTPEVAPAPAPAPVEPPQQMAQAQPAPAPETPPAPVAAPSPAPDNQSADRQADTSTLPHTASPYPLAGLIGLLAIAASGVVTVVAKRRA